MSPPSLAKSCRQDRPSSSSPETARARPRSTFPKARDRSPRSVSRQRSTPILAPATPRSCASFPPSPMPRPAPIALAMCSPAAARRHRLERPSRCVFRRRPCAKDPTYTVKVMTVSALWPGASTSELQAQVGDRLEKRLQELTWYDRAETVVRPGLLLIKLYLKDSMPPSAVQEEFYQARKKLSDEAANLPRGVVGPLANDEYSDRYFALYALQARGLPHRELVLQAEALRQRLLRVPGVEKINIL